MERLYNLQDCLTGQGQHHPYSSVVSRRARRVWFGRPRANPLVTELIL